MTENILSYDKDVFGRRFMHCGQRHGMVFLQRRGVPVENLFYNALQSSDLLLEQIIIEKKPKYKFKSNFYSESDLDVLGVRKQEISAEYFIDLTELIDEAIREDKFLLLGGDVFYFPHCPEYRNAHLSHQVVLRGIRPDGLMEIVDDNPASILCEYVYSRHQVANFFDNNIRRRVIRLIQTREINTRESLDEMRRRFDKHIQCHSDSFKLYELIGDYLLSSFETLEGKIRCLHETFTLLSGSRLCSRRYLEYIDAPQKIIFCMQDLADKSFALKSIFVKAQITRKLDVDRVIESSNRYKKLEMQMLSLLQEFIANRTVRREY